MQQDPHAMAPSPKVSVQLPRDLCYKEHVPSEWWYYNGHLSDSDRRLTFHVAFFRQRTDSVRVGRWLPLRLFGTHYWCAHFSLMDLQTGESWFTHRRSLWWHGRAERDRFKVRLGRWSIEGDCASQRLRIGPTNMHLDLHLSIRKSASLHGDQGRFHKHPEQECFYFSFSKIDAHGFLKLNDKELPVQGTCWMDREYGSVTMAQTLRGWDWFCLQLDDGRELLIYVLRSRQPSNLPPYYASLIDQGGKAQFIPIGGCNVIVESQWTNPATRNTYPSKWRIELPSLAMVLQVQPLLQEHEIDTRGSTNVLFWEGPVAVSGTEEGQCIQGRGFVELVGYDSEHRIGTFDFACQNMPLLGLAQNQLANLCTVCRGIQAVPRRVSTRSAKHPEGGT
ncbi:lipocalin family protein [Novipirellula artificiosorum]|uniref:Hydroxyneurosporene synthase (CrtC) n=1 Tax=Novipirellula artificiosorum TaxID=2528016 RepID=A0A5C6DTP0_9BACT|nr:lipocalin family protein [Novipirellula artificiosorum]TWU39685.1 Hydroxyneurosporene synthase (CrtC) [Novipirellula artificiosorum]